MKLSVIIPVHNAQAVTAECLRLLSENSVTQPEVIIIDNASDVVTRYEGYDGIDITVVRNDKNVGVWPTFKQGLKAAKGDVLAYIHNDLMIHEFAWDKRLLAAFAGDDKLGLVGFVGSDEWGDNGGRGGGTVSNFQGKQIGEYKGSPAEAHGKRSAALVNALQVDGCAMVMTRSAMLTLGWFDWPPHHFYDRIYSLRMVKAGFHVGVLGIECDHISGQTANTQPGWQDTAREWAEAHGIAKWGDNWDQTIYHEAENRFLPELHEYMHGRQLIRVLPNHNVV